MIQEYVCVDLETTGLDPKTEKIIEIGAVRVKDGEIISRFQSFINPGRLLSQEITDLTGISEEDLSDAPAIEEVLPDFLSYCGEACIMGHNVLFDYSFLKKAVVNMDKNNKFERMGIDTLKIARKHLSSLESRSLSYLCEYYHIEQKAHRALEDAVATHRLYKKLLEEFYPGNEADFCAQKLIYNVKRETPITNAQKERGCRFKE